MTNDQFYSQQCAKEMYNCMACLSDMPDWFKFPRTNPKVLWNLWAEYFYDVDGSQMTAEKASKIAKTCQPVFDHVYHRVTYKRF